MVARTGLHTAPVPGNPPLGTAPVDGRIVQAALFGSSGQCLNGGGYAASVTTMDFTIAAGVYQIPDTANGGAVYHSPVDSAVLTPSAGQAGGRIDSIYVLQQDYEKNGTTSRVIYGIAAGTPGTGTAPSLSGIPGGPMRLMNITVPASATKATDCTVSWVVPPANVALDGSIAANKTLLDLMPGTYPGQRAFAAGIDYRWTGGNWQAWDSDWIGYTPSMSGPAGAYNATPGFAFPVARYKYRSGIVQVQVGVILNAGTGLAGQWVIGLPIAPGIAGRIQAPGRIKGFDDSAGAEYELIYSVDVGGQSKLYVKAFNGTNGATADTGPNVPFTWAQNDRVDLALEYVPA